MKGRRKEENINKIMKEEKKKIILKTERVEEWKRKRNKKM